MAKLFRLKELLYRYPRLGRFQHQLVCSLAYFGMNFWEDSFNKMRVMHEKTRTLINNRQQVIYALYHGNMDLMLEFPRRSTLTVLISASRDGDMMEIIADWLGYKCARGSSARRGVSGLLGMIEAAHQGRSLVMLIDGPKGPRHDTKPGIVKLAQVTGLPIVPTALSARSCFFVKSWDRFNIPSYLGPKVGVYGEPIYVPANATDEQLEEIRLQVDRRMRELCDWSENIWEMTDVKRLIGFAG
jgi:lysophospholipid acyltransferase (LPLAT)-like uncharacterized protein